jgi:hypothetical protein
MPSCEKNLTKLYSSVNFSNPEDSKSFGKWDIDSKLKVLVHFVGEYINDVQPSIYFKAKVTLDAVVCKSGKVTKSNIVVKDICFKNEFNVSANSQTDEYKYLYDISCSSADNASSSCSSKHKSCSSDSCSSDLSLSDIYVNGIEKQIMTNVKEFMESDAFKITWVLEKGFFTLNTTKFNSGNTFPNVKMTIKHKLTSSSSSCFSSSSSCHKPNNFIKMLIMGFVAILVIMFLLKFLKNNNYGDYANLYDNVFGSVNKLFSKASGMIKSLFPKKDEYTQEHQPYDPDPVPVPVHEPYEHDPDPVHEPYEHDPVPVPDPYPVVDEQ